MKKVFLSVLFVTGSILPTTSFGGLDGARLEADVRTTTYHTCEVSGVSQYPEQLAINVMDCNSGWKTLTLHVNIQDPMMSSISSMAQNAFIFKKKVQFSAKSYDFESIIENKTAAVLKIKSFKLISE